MKEIHCGEYIAGCPHVARADTTDELLKKVQQHAREEHDITEIDDELRQALISGIRER